MNQTMTRLLKMKEDEYSSFIRTLFGLSSPSPVSDPGVIEWIDPSLNDSQKDAIKFALGAREMALIHGPPGVSPSHNQKHNIANMKIDRENSHTNRTHPSNVETRLESSSLWTFEYLG